VSAAGDERESENGGAGACAVYVDMGTTNTRVWLARGDVVLARASAACGVRDTARDGTNERLKAALRRLIADVWAEAREADGGGASCEPSCVVAAGMIASPLGLAEVPHVPAPAGERELADGVERHRFPDVTPLPFLLVPGVRSGALGGGPRGTGAADLMRGEETLCVGLLARGLSSAQGAVLNLGSHWKAILVDREGRVASSVTSLSGELLYAAQTQTILASAVPHERPGAVAGEWMRAGMAEQRARGLARALFCVRLLEQGGEGTPEERLSYLVGAFVAGDLDALTRDNAFSGDVPVAITGGWALGEAWRLALGEAGISARVVDAADVERSLLTGLSRIAERTTDAHR
jgi:2-dehydro-3-deoxygalactonokinase